MPENDTKLTIIEIAKVLTHAAYKALSDFEPDSKISLDEAMELVKQAIGEIIVEAGD